MLDGNDGEPIVSGGARDKKGAPVSRATEEAQGAPLYSHIRELAPRADIEVDESSTNRDHEEPERTGFFAQATRISMGNAFPALRSVARFLTLESYRSLPKLDKLPDLNREPELELEPTTETPSSDPRAEELLDWDELEIEELTPTPYQLYLFDLRIEGYLNQTRRQLSARLLQEA